MFEKEQFVEVPKAARLRKEVEVKKKRTKVADYMESGSTVMKQLTFVKLRGLMRG